MRGDFSARFLETSGKTITLPSSPRIHANGGWLIDPADITIGNFGGQNPDNLDIASQVDAQWLSSYLANPEFESSWISFDASNSITVASNVSGIGKSIQLQAGNTITINASLTGFGRINLFAPNVTISGVQLIASDHIIIGKERTLGGNIQITGGKIQSTSGTVGIYGSDVRLLNGTSIMAHEHVELWGRLADQNDSVDPINTVLIGKNSSVTAAGIDISAKSLILSGGTLNGEYIQAYGKRTYDPSHSPESDDEYIRETIDSIQLKPDAGVESSLSASGEVWLETKELLLSRNGSAALISGPSVFLRSDDVTRDIVIPAGSESAPMIKTTNMHFEGGSYLLHPYAIQAANLVWASGVKLEGVATTDAPHIFGVDRLYINDSGIIGMLGTEVAESPFPSVTLWDKSGEVWKGTIQPEDPNPEDPAIEAKRNVEYALYIYYFLKQFNQSHQPQSYEDSLLSLQDELLHRYVKEDIQNTDQTQYNNLQGYNYAAFADNVLGHMDADQPGYIMQVSAADFRLVVETIYMLRYIQEAGNSFESGWNHAQLTEAYLKAFDKVKDRKNLDETLWLLQILNPAYSTTNRDAIASDYAATKTAMLQVVRYHSKNNAWNTDPGDTSERQHRQLKEEYEYARTQMAPFIVTWCGKTDSEITPEVLVEWHKLAIAAKEKWEKDQEENKELEDREQAQIQEKLAQMRILEPSYVYKNYTTLVNDYNRTRSQMLHVVRYHYGDTSWTPTNDNQLKGRFENARRDMVPFITEWLGYPEANIPNDRLVTYYEAAKRASMSEPSPSEEKNPDKYINPNPVEPAEPVVTGSETGTPEEGDDPVVSAPGDEGSVTYKDYKEYIDSIVKTDSNGNISKEYASEIMPYALYAKVVYGDSDIILGNLLGSQVYKASGFEASSYYDPTLNKIIISFAGSNFSQGGDIGADLGISQGLVTSKQFKQAFEFFNTIMSDKKTFDYFFNHGADVVITGHSLGGALAQLVGAVTGYQTFAFNPAPVPPALIGEVGFSVPTSTWEAIKLAVRTVSAWYVGEIPLAKRADGEQNNIHIIRSILDPVSMSHEVTDSIHLTEDIINVSGGGLHGIDGLISGLENASGESATKTLKRRAS